MLPNRILLRAHSHANFLAIKVQIVERHVEEASITTRPLDSHCHNVERACLTSSIWSKETKYFALFNTKRVLINSCYSIVINFHEIISLDKILVTLLILLLWVIPNCLRELSMRENIRSLIQLHSLHNFVTIAI